MLRILFIFIGFCTFFIYPQEGYGGKILSSDMLISLPEPIRSSSFFVSAGPAKELTCSQQVVTLEGSFDPALTNVSVEWTTNTGNFTGSRFVINPDVNRAGTYYLQVTNLDNGEVMTDSVIITKNEILPTINFQPYAELNCRDSSVLVNFSWTRDPSAVISDYEINWTTIPGTGAFDFSKSTLNEGKVVMIKPAQYFFEVIDRRNGCTVRDTITITANYSTQPAEAGGDRAITCSSDYAILRADTTGHPPGTSYMWSTVDGSLDGLTILDTIKATSVGTYVLEVIDPDSHCSSFDTIEIGIDRDLPDIIIGAPPILNCHLNEITLDASLSTQGNNLIPAWTSAGGGSIISGANTYTPLINSAGRYTLRLENTVTGCFSEESVEVSGNYEKVAPVILSVDTLNCVNHTAAVRLANSQNHLVQYGWFNASHQLISSFSDLTHTAVFQGGNLFVVSRHQISGCADTAYFVVPEFKFQPLSDAGTGKNLDCSGLPVVLDGSASVTGLYPKIEWLNQNDQVLTENELTYTTQVAGLYKLRITDRKSKCLSTSDVVVTPDMNAPDISAGPGQTLTCDVRTVALQGQIISTLANYEIEWSSPTGNLVLGNTSSLTPIVNTPGVYTLTVKDLDNQCPSSSNVVIEEDVEEPLAMAGDPINFNCDQEFIALIGQTNISNPVVRWTSFGGAFGSSTNSLATTVIQPGIYTLTVRNPYTGCENSSFVIVRAPENFPAIDAGRNMILDCKNETVILNGTSNIQEDITITWDGPGNILNSNGLTPSVGREGIYTLSVTNNKNNCTAIDSVMVEERRDGPDTADIIAYFHDCDNANASILVGGVLGGKPPYQFEISGLTNPGDNFIFDNLDAGFDYIVNIIDDGGCIYSEVIHIDSTGVPAIILPLDFVVTTPEGIQLNPVLPAGFQGNLTYSWFPADGLSCSDCLNPVAAPRQSTHYKLTVMSEDGCEAVFSTLVTVEEKDHVYFPNTFTPNGDKINDFFTAFGDDRYVESIAELYIFDRGGNVVFQGTNLPINNDLSGWDGTFRSRELAPAVFVFTAEILFKDGKRKQYSGDINLLR